MAPPAGVSLPPVIAPEELVDPGVRHHVLFVDARSGPDAVQRFKARHLENAVHVDLEHDLAASNDDPAHGGRHPLPDPSAFSRVLQWLGVGPHLRIVVYDDQGGANAAARFWWMVRAAGHPNVQVLDGGLDAAIRAGIPTGVHASMRPTVRHLEPFSSWTLPIADLEETERAARDPARRVIDVRDPVRYRGESDPFDPNPGHVPGAINLPYAGNLGPDGRFLPPDELRARYERALAGVRPEDAIVHCGSGVTACHAIVAMARAGMALPKLYVGSWSEYARRGRPIAKGPDPG